MRKNGDGTVTLTAIQTYTGQTDINQGALQVTTAVIDDNSVNVDLNAGIIFNQDTNGSYAGIINGNGALIKLGIGTVTLNGVNNFTGGTFINAGALSIGQDNNLGGASGSLTMNGGTLQSTGTFVMDRLTALGVNGGVFLTDAATTLTQNGQITGVGQLTKEGSGTLVLGNASNNYTGGTLLNDGILQAGIAGSLINNTMYTINGGTLDLNTYDLSMSLLSGTGGIVNVDSANLTLNQSADSQFSGVFNGNNTANISKTNTGNLRLTGDSSSYLGTFILDNGNLIIDGSLGGTMQVNSNGRLNGAGSVGDTTVYGVIAPGNSIGVLTVNGNYVQSVGSTYEVEINPLGQSDLINVTGTADINGGTVKLIKEAGVFLSETRYTILSAAGGVNGQYDNLVQYNLPYLNLALVYDTNHVYLDIFRNNVSFSVLGETPNEIATADAIETMGTYNPLYTAIVNLPDGQSARAAFNSLSGEIHASLLGSLLENSRYIREAILNQLTNNTHCGSSITTGEGVNYWAQSYNSWGTTEGNSNAARLGNHSRGLFIGADTNAMNPWRLGLVTGIGRSDYDVAVRQSQASSENSYLGFYTSRQGEQFAVRSGATWAWHQLDTQRQVIFSGINNLQNAHYAARTAQVFTELGYTILNTNPHLEPILQLNYVSTKNNPFYEQGSTTTALTGSKAIDNMFYSTFGMRSNMLFLKNETSQYRVLSLFGWRHTSSQVTPNAVFSFNSSEPFLIGGAPIAHDALLIDAGIEISLLSHNINMKIGYSGQIARNVQDHGIEGKLSYRFL